MICPKCGKNTAPGNQCEHCGNPTEFITRSVNRPDAIPGFPQQDEGTSPNSAEVLKELQTVVSSGFSRQKRTLTVYCGVFMALFLLCAVGNLVLLMQMKSLLRQDEMSAENEQFPASVQQAGKVCFSWNDVPAAHDIPLVTTGETLPLLPDQEGMRFTGWNTRTDGQGTSFQSGEPFELELAADLILFAQWEPQEIPPEPDAAEEEQTDSSEDLTGAENQEVKREPLDGTASEEKEIPLETVNEHTSLPTESTQTIMPTPPQEAVG